MKIAQHTFIITVGMICFAVIVRLLPHVPNVVPIGALALWAGAYYPKSYAWVIPLCAMLLSDMIIGFHAMMFSVYLSYGLIALLGGYLKKHSVTKVISFSLASSLLFFFLTNFNYWSDGSLYPKTMNGLITAYTMAIPFFRNTIIGDLIFTCTFFYGFNLITVLIKTLGFGMHHFSLNEREDALRQLTKFPGIR